MKRLLNIVVLLLGLSGLSRCLALETRIIGEVYSASTGEPLANVSVYFKGTQVGTTTDDKGLFYLHVDLMRTASLTFSSIGYKTQRFTIEPGKDAGLAVVLEEKRHQLEEFVVLPGANPALPLMDSVRAHRALNKPVDASYNGQSEQQFFLSHITSETLKRRLWKSLQSGMIMQEDSTYILPLPASLYTSLSVPLPSHLDFYNPTLPFGSLSLLSPTAASAPAYYHFFLIDSLSAPKRYLVDFRPKNSFDPLFTGTLTIDSTTFAITDVKASIPRDANVNYLTSLHYDSHYQPLAAGTVMQGEQMSAVLDLAVRTDSSHIFPALLAKQKYESDLEVGGSEGLRNVQKGSFFASSDDRLSRAEGLFAPQTAQPDSAELPLFRFASWLGWLVHTGYARTGTPVDIGNILELIQVNRYETVHLGLPFRTNEQLFPHVSLEGYVGYGIRDHGIKYKAQVQVILPTQRRNILGAYVWDRYVYSEVSDFDRLARENSWVYGNMPFMTYLLNDVFYKNSGAVPSAVRKRELRLWSENDWCSSSGARPSVETTTAVQMGHLGFGNPCDYHYYDMPSFRFASLSTVVRLGWHEQVADLYLTRKHLYSTYPTVFLGAEMGSYQREDMSHYRMYGKLQLMVRQDASLGMGGTLSYLLQAGIVLGKVPEGLLASINGNSSYTYAPTRFTLMNSNTFRSDKYVALHVDWNGQGILFNRIPGVRYLRLRELAEFKVAYYGEPYAEIGVGIGNILRIGEVYSIWRLTNNADTAAPRWAVRFRLHLGL